MAIKFEHPAYFTEKQLCDKLEDQFKQFGWEYIREFKFGRSVFDFILFPNTKSPFKHPHINIVEVKLSADFNAVRQIAFYKSLMIETLRSNDRWDLRVGCAIYARTFDSLIVDTLNMANVSAYQVDVLSDESISTTSLGYEESNYLVDDCSSKLIFEKFPVSHE